MIQCLPLSASREGTSALPACHRGSQDRRSRPKSFALPRRQRYPSPRDTEERSQRLQDRKAVRRTRIREAQQLPCLRVLSNRVSQDEYNAVSGRRLDPGCRASPLSQLGRMNTYALHAVQPSHPWRAPGSITKRRGKRGRGAEPLYGGSVNLTSQWLGTPCTTARPAPLSVQHGVQNPRHPR